MCPEMYFFTNRQFITAHRHYYCLDNIPLHSVNASHAPPRESGSSAYLSHAPSPPTNKPRPS